MQLTCAIFAIVIVKNNKKFMYRLNNYKKNNVRSYILNINYKFEFV